MKRTKSKRARVLWKSRKKDNGLGHKYKIILDKQGWIRTFVKAEGKGEWLCLDDTVYKKSSLFDGILGGFEEAIGRELLKVGDLK